MKRLIFLIVGVGILITCSTQKGVIKVNSEVDEVVQDSVEYGLETFDGKFESWYQMHNSPARYRSLQYYESWNNRYVIAWNAHAMSARNTFFEPIIGYEPNEDYGFELNHELFHYFMYVENVLNIQILEGGPRSPMF